MFKSFIHIFIKHIVLICITVTASLIVAIGYLRFISTPTYEASVELVASDSVDQLSVYNELFSNGSLKKGIYELSKKNKSTSNIGYRNIENMKMNYNAGNPVFSISATGSNPVQTAELANLAAAYFTANIGKYVSGVNVGVVLKAKTPTTPIKPVGHRVIMVVVMIAVLVGFGLSIIKELYKNSTLDQDYMNNVIGLSDLGSFTLDKNNKNV